MMNDGRPDLSPEALSTREAETELTAGGPDRGHEEAASLPCLTLLAHPDRDRVGERIVLPTLALGHTVRLSRLEPVFALPRGGIPRSLASPRISRQPVLLEGAARGSVDAGSVRLDRGQSRTPLEVDGQRVDSPLVLSTASIERGVVLELGQRVVLLLHHLRPSRDELPPALGLVGESASMVRLRREILRVAHRDVAVLLRGETGTGKELVARALHRASPRRAGPFVAVNMATLTASLATANLFGSTKGAFTGATRAKQGFFQKANGGTLFLDEIGEAPPELQALLLRTLESGEVIPVGGVDPVAVDVRVVTATDLDLEQAIDNGSFRAPLYHRLAGYTLRLPPLRQRRDDLGRLLFHFLDGEREEGDPKSEEPPWPSARIVARLARHEWPGNVRQLRNVARWLAIRGDESDTEEELEELLGEGLASGEPRGAPALPPTPTASPTRHTHRGTTPSTTRRAPSTVTDDELLEALRANGWRLKPTASQLGISRTSLYALIDRSPSIRRAADLGADELETALERCSGELEAMADELRVSPQGLRHRLQELGLSAKPRN